MYQLKIKNGNAPGDYRTIDLTLEEWLAWKELLVQSKVCSEETFASDNTRMVITYYPGHPPPEQDEENILDLL